MTPTTELLLLNAFSFWIGWLLGRWRTRALAARADARALIQSARAGTDLTDLRENATKGFAFRDTHWSDVCRHCHHERSRHHDNTGLCLFLDKQTSQVCECDGFEPSR